MEKRLNCLGEACPVPLIKTEQAMKKMNIGDVLIVSIDHSCASKNIPEWARQQEYNYKLKETNPGEWEVIIEKSK